jgi:hypothetical protein
MNVGFKQQQSNLRTLRKEIYKRAKSMFGGGNFVFKDFLELMQLFVLIFNSANFPVADNWIQHFVPSQQKAEFSKIRRLSNFQFFDATSLSEFQWSPSKANELLSTITCFFLLQEEAKVKSKCVVLKTHQPATTAQGLPFLFIHNANDK